MSTISTNVMRRVRTIHAVRPFLSGTALAALTVILALWEIGREVWVARVIENLEIVAKGGDVTAFIVSAFVNAQFLVQALSVLTLAAAAWLVYDGLRTLGLTPRAA